MTSSFFFPLLFFRATFKRARDKLSFSRALRETVPDKKIDARRVKRRDA